MPDNFKTYLRTNAGLTDEQIAQLNNLMSSRTINKGQILLKEGEICKHSFFVERGLLRAFTVDNNGKEHIIQFAPENWFIADRDSLYFNTHSNIFIDTIEETDVVLIDQSFINLASTISETFRQYNEKLLHNHIRYLQKRINMLISASAEERYLDFIKIYPDILLRVPQSMVASYLGITPESLSRVRKDLAIKNKNG